jgi:hypothetical protein
MRSLLSSQLVLTRFQAIDVLLQDIVLASGTSIVIINWKLTCMSAIRSAMVDS